MQNVNSKSTILVVFLAIFCSYPYVFGQFLPLPTTDMVWISSFCLLMAISLSCKNSMRIPSLFNIIVSIQVVGWFLFSLVHNDNSYFTRIFLIFWCYIAVLCLIKTKSILLFSKINNKIICTQSALGAVAFALCLLGLLGPLIYFENVDGRDAAFLGLTCTNAIYGNFIRPAGFFDEPGALACWGIFSLVINKIFYCDKKVEYVLIFGLLFTFSMAYYIQLIAYLFLFNTKHFKKIMPLCILLGIVGVIIYQKAQNDADLYYMTIRRVDDAVNGSTNRDAMADAASVVFLKNPLWGIGAINASNFSESLSDNPFETLATDGIIGTILIYFPFLWVLIKYKVNKDLFKAVAILAIGFLQRPFHITLLHYMTMYIFVYLAIYFNNNKYKELCQQHH